jgi:hypothetical protein
VSREYSTLIQLNFFLVFNLPDDQVDNEIENLLDLNEEEKNYVRIFFFHNYFNYFIAFFLEKCYE